MKNEKKIWEEINAAIYQRRNKNYKFLKGALNSYFISPVKKSLLFACILALRENLKAPKWHVDSCTFLPIQIQHLLPLASEIFSKRILAHGSSHTLSFNLRFSARHLSFSIQVFVALTFIRFVVRLFELITFPAPIQVSILLSLTQF